MIREQSVGRTAVVMGGSMAGLLAARILADHFTCVIIVERDQLPPHPVHRQGVPQSRHVHVLLARGAQELDRLFPNLGEELQSAGAPRLNWMNDIKWLNFTGWKPRFPAHLVSYGCSRELLEWTVRRRLVESGRIRFEDCCQVTGLLDGGNGHVRGVTVRRRSPVQGADEVEDMPADLVVDATGRDSHAPRWLQSLGYAPPEETVINSFLGYASRVYRQPSSPSRDWKGLYIQQTPPTIRRGGVIFPMEDDRWMVMLVGTGRDYPPTDEAGFLAFACSLVDPCIHDAIKDAEPLSPIYGIRRVENRYRHFERLRRRPENFIVLGDAAIAFNPVYGQGMTVAALAAGALNTCLHRWKRKRRDGDLTGLAGYFQTRLSRVLNTPWLLATGEDFRVPEVEGGRPGLSVHLLHRYVDGVMHVATDDRSAHLAVSEVLSLMKPPTALFAPGIVRKVVQRSLSG